MTYELLGQQQIDAPAGQTRFENRTPLNGFPGVSILVRLTKSYAGSRYGSGCGIALAPDDHFDSDAPEDVKHRMAFIFADAGNGLNNLDYVPLYPEYSGFPQHIINNLEKKTVRLDLYFRPIFLGRSGIDELYVDGHLISEKISYPWQAKMVALVASSAGCEIGPLTLGIK